MSTRPQAVLITGCTSGGIGFELGKEYRSKGLRVFATARRAEVCEELTALGFEAIQLDVTKDESVHAARNQVAEMTGGVLDILVNNAGRSAAGIPAVDANMNTILDVFETNLFGVMRMVQAFVPLLITSGDGRIVNISSIASVMPYPFNSAYNASKAAVNAYGSTLRVELAPFNIQVTTVITGAVKSHIIESTPALAPTSIYAPIADHFARYMAGISKVGGTPTEVYARSVVSQTFRRSLNSWFWTGKFSFLCWFIDTFLGRTGFDRPLSREFGLTALKKVVEERKDA
ncbi:Arabinanase/levansucrase/invertase superfamily protein [Mycena chlorophos]|uniref:Arabinanase/levansucrase/invertase superfamily protein n=1 Tax=Mycena chlorophos TaxID=658473 RepID=A0A8H6TLA7_MYCCL|nr:Arabinanase/levansucrase/invertase superfamily protein [Mycena chlorophos]